MFAYRVSLPGLLNVVGSYDNGFIAVLGDLDEMSPDALSKKWVHTDCGLIQDE